MKDKFCLLLVLIALMCLVGWTGYGQGHSVPVRETWEYKEASLGTNDEPMLNTLGAQGWELVAVTVENGHYWAYMKRAK
jgi:hypothetical protein